MKTFVVFLGICSLSFFEIGALELPTCPTPSDSGVSVCQTSAAYPSACLDDAREACRGYGHHLCSLDELKAAFDSGVTTSYWNLVDVRDRDARISICQVGSGHRYEGDECFVKVGDYATWHIPNTPRPSTNARAFCCKNDPATFTYHDVQITIETI
ncbi:uncharacterized protein LOC119728779 [Patiria miniata]|uniref:Uncharacterized protein n=1 Tax=Patiria miniata TaxID=46514 RepID=A0A914A076_PATMI|nr:uncharacterized protein LOC119728779 [Patiria miniata]